jgi:hypothetical protein
MRALDDQVRLGKVRYLGISDTPVWVVAQMQTLAADRGWSTFAGLQIEYSIAQAIADIADGLGLSSSVVALAWIRAQGGPARSGQPHRPWLPARLPGQRRLHPRWHVRPARPATGPVSSRLSTARQPRLK